MSFTSFLDKSRGQYFRRVWGGPDPLFPPSGTPMAISDVFEVKNKDKMAAELNTVDLIARRNISFNFLDHLLPTLHFIADD